MKQFTRTVAIAAAGWVIFTPLTRAAVPDAKGIEFFEKKIRPVLADKCYQCHSAQAEKLKGKLFVDTREGLLRGGESGKPSIVPGAPEKSLLIEALRHTNEDLKMPPKEKLSDAMVADFVAWIKMGAPDPREGKAPAVAAKKTAPSPEEGKNFWSFKPLATMTPPKLKTSSWIRTPVDNFILAKLEAAKIQPNNAIEKRKLIRRACFDLIGMPPTPEEIESFANDTSPRAYEVLIDRLLASPHYGERWARHWLDLARFGESHGYEQDYDRPFAFHYRDFVIRALNNDLPYDKFVKWQIAGDELAPDNPEAWFATGFLGAGTHATQITANQAEKERYDELDDQIATIGTSMLGLTLGCARCHDHKFDPVPTADYYRLISTFTTTVRSDHDVDLNPAETRRLQAEFDAKMKPLRAAREAFEREKLPARLDAWLAGDPALPQPEWITLDLEGFKASGGYYGINSTKRQEDGSWVVSISAGSPDTISFTAKTALTNFTALRLEALTHSSLPNGGPGWSKDGGFNLQTLTVTAKPSKGGKQSAALAFTRRRSHGDKEPSNTPVPWLAKGNTQSDQLAVFETEKPFGFADGTELSFTLKFPTSFDRNLIGRLRVCATRVANASIDGAALVLVKDLEAAQSAFAIEPAKRTAAQKDALSKIYRTTEPEWLKLNAAVQEHLRNEPKPQLVKALVCSEGLPAIRLHTQGPDFYEKTYILKRGDLAQKITEAQEGFLQVLMRSPEKEKHWLAEPPKDSRTPFRRASLANWITDTDQGAGNLLARVIVNRLWQHHFGRGIVSTPSDFGAMGDRPTHPELLDWLAGELIKSGWRLKPLHKLIMMSAVYQQGDATDAKRAKADSENHLWWHRSPQRLEAEGIRDNVLAVSGRLDDTMFGAGTLDEGMRRRSVYFFIKRSKLIPMMVQFDAPDSLQGLGRRVNTTVAPQALYMMNNPNIRACAVDFAKKLKSQAEKSPDDAVKSAYETTIGRAPTKAELSDAIAFITQESATYKRGDALELALADFCQVLFGLNEFIYVE
ncbi:MAG: PSD1 domain-containing protein [Verrucomicrobia bacterium]|nr:PSD1 domain-containing protein [Verrucomicrobiota bacterium]